MSNKFEIIRKSSSCPTWIKAKDKNAYFSAVKVEAIVKIIAQPDAANGNMIRLFTTHSDGEFRIWYDRNKEKEEFENDLKTLQELIFNYIHYVYGPF